MSYGRGVRVLAAWLLDEGYALTEAQADRKARRVLLRALPTRQKQRRQRPADLREAA